MLQGLLAVTEHRRAGLALSNDVDAQGHRPDTACVICMENEGDYVLIPCGHGGYCGACARTLLTLGEPKSTGVCPICRGDITSAVQIHLSTPVGAEGEALDAAVVVQAAPEAEKAVAASDVTTPAVSLRPPPTRGAPC